MPFKKDINFNRVTGTFMIINKSFHSLEGGYASEKECLETSSQDGGIGRYTLPPQITKRRTTTI